MKVDIGQWVCEAWVWSLRMVPKAGWEQNMLHGVKRVVKFCETISAVFTVNLEDFRRYYRYSSCVCINNWLYTGHQIILAHRWLQVQELHGVWHPLPEPEWYKTQSLGAKITVSVCLKKFRRDSVRTTVNKNRMNEWYTDDAAKFLQSFGSTV